MTYEKAKEIATELTDMSTTGEDFFAEYGEAAKFNIGSPIVIERYNDEGWLETMTPEYAIGYARVFVLGGSIKACEALRFLHEHRQLNECKPTRHLIREALETALGILSNID